MPIMMENSFASQHYPPFSYSVARLGQSEPEFRILELLPGAQGEQLACHLVVAKLAESAGRFKALSYVWGTGSKSCTILIAPPTGEAGELKSVSINELVHTALIHLRRPDNPVRLWIDQICINQDDNAEKGGQVSLMGSIYSTAEEVLVWLGPAANDSDALMDAWRRVGQPAQDWGLGSYNTRERLGLLNLMLNSPDPSNPTDAEFTALLKTATDTFPALIKDGVLLHWLDRPWFTRAWTVQEFCLCPTTTFVCGTKTVSAEVTMLALHLLIYSLTQFLPLYRAAVPPPLLQAVIANPTDNLFSCRQRHQHHLKLARMDPSSSSSPSSSPATGYPLHALLHKLHVEHTTHATLPRDRIFSLLSLAVDAPHLAITPNYTTMTDAEVLATAARAMITNPSTGRVAILSFAQPPLSIPDLPSWAPDWRGNLARSFYQPAETAGEGHVFAACGAHTSVEHLATQDPMVLGLGGWEVDVIEEVALGEAWEEMGWDAGRYVGFFGQVDALVRVGEVRVKNKGVPRFYKGNKERWEEARWRVPTGDLYWTAGGKGLKRMTGAGRVRYEECVETVRLLDECGRLANDEAGRRLEEWGFDGRLQQGEVGADYRESMKYMKGKRPFLTREGYLGMGPAGVQAGDVVVVFCGGRIPFVLRPRGLQGGEKRFELVGEAYSDGVMDGEVAEAGARSDFYLI